MKKTSIRVKILVPVLLLFVISVVSNVLAINNLRKVNEMASVIADNYLGAITELDTIGQTTKNIHTLALSHIVATDFETMTGVVVQIEEQENALEDYIKNYQKYVDSNTADNYQNMTTDYQSFKESVMILLAQSANQKTKDAYATANGVVADSSKKLNDDINAIISSYKEYASSERHLLTMGFMPRVLELDQLHDENDQQGGDKDADRGDNKGMALIISFFHHSMVRFRLG